MWLEASYNYIEAFSFRRITGAVTVSAFRLADHIRKRQVWSSAYINELFSLPESSNDQSQC